eukprot:CAMPEP_0117526032 /NCGR_PEP_ID=MMETSP0784-20121206/36078_1 /TAXON_ID=39447 /ORGANISM="" /LENGTH=135 /DNA_ID=CAMNT_0005322251 /DNA_START=298 /DNA_END=706 /DNA_ORIENTATION=-
MAAATDALDSRAKPLDARAELVRADSVELGALSLQRPAKLPGRKGRLDARAELRRIHSVALRPLAFFIRHAGSGAESDPTAVLKLPSVVEPMRKNCGIWWPCCMPPATLDVALEAAVGGGRNMADAAPASVALSV